ncbi:MAG: VWA domain-containing protein [Candidatus Hodarchaeales archaeon]|jgi:uncharacterized protein YegL
MKIRDIMLSVLLISIVASSIISYLALNSSKQNLSMDFEIGAENSLLEKTITQAKQLDSLLGKTASIVESSATFAKLIFSDDSIPSVTSYYHNPEVGNAPPDLVYSTEYGREISTAFSAYKIAPTAFDESDQNMYLNQDPETWNPLDHVNSSISDTILKSAKLDLLWRELYVSFPGHVWLYMGFEFGFHRSFPWHSYSKSYDPRIRPWYVGAVTGAKDVVVILDTSGSMVGDPLTNTKEAVKNVFKTLGPRDRLTVISFSGNVRTFRDDLEIYSNILQTDADDYVDSLVADGSTNINQAILDGLDILKNEGSEDRTPVIIFMTDGEPTAGLTSKNQILNSIQSTNDLDAKIFVFGLGQGIDNEFLSDIAQQNAGAAVFIENNDDIPDAMNRYYQFFTSEPSESLIWSYPYIDQSGFGFIITASKPVIVEDKFYGVISADLTLIHLIEEMKEFQPSPNGYNFIFDSAGVMVVHPNIFDKEPSDWTTQDIRIPIEDFETYDNEFITIKDQVVLGDPASNSVSYGSDKRVVAFAPIGNTSLRFASVIPHSDIARSNAPNLFQIEMWQISWSLFSGIGAGIGVLVILRSKKLFEGGQ